MPPSQSLLLRRKLLPLAGPALVAVLASQPACRLPEDDSARSASGLTDPCDADPSAPLTINALEPATIKVAPGSSFDYRLRLTQAGAPLDNEHVPFVHFVSETDESWFAFQDFPIAEPASGTWAGEVSFPRTVTPPANASGKYSIRAGVLDRKTSQNIKLAAGPGVAETFTEGVVGYRYTLGTLEISAPASSGDLYSVETLVDDMRLPNDRGWWLATNGDLTADRNGPDQGAGQTYAYVQNGVRQADQTSFWPKKYLDSSFGFGGGTPINRLGWFVITRAAQSATRAPNTRAQTRNFKNLALRRNGTWTDAGSSPINADPYPAAWYSHFSSPGNEETIELTTGGGIDQARNESSGGASVGSISAGSRDGWSLHAWPAGHQMSQAEWVNDVVGVLTVFEGRLIVHDPNQPDDRASANLMVWTGADWYTNGSYIGEHSHGRLKLLTNDWRIFSTTDIPAAELRAHPPPGYSR